MPRDHQQPDTSPDAVLLKQRFEKLGRLAGGDLEKVARHGGESIPLPAVRVAEFTQDFTADFLRLLPNHSAEPPFLEVASKMLDLLLVGQLHASVTVAAVCASSPQMRDWAARMLIGRKAAFVGGRAARRELRERADELGLQPAELLRKHLLPAGLFLAAADSARPRPIRLRRRWVNGRQADVSPDELSLMDFVAFLQQEGRRHAEEALSGPRAQGSRGDAPKVGDCPECGAALDRRRACPRCGLAVPKDPFRIPKEPGAVPAHPGAPRQGPQGEGGGAAGVRKATEKEGRNNGN